jgi:hypothetical protein
MLRGLAIAIAFGLAVAVLAQEELPKANPEENLEIDPPLLIKDGKPLVPLPSPGESAANDPQQLTVAVEKAKRVAAASERLWKAGIIAKVQVEDRALKVVRLERDLANSRLEIAKQEHAEKQQQLEDGKATQAEVDEASTAERAAEETARIAVENCHRAELDVARANVERQKKLLALGSGHRSDVNRAEEKLSQLNTAEE